MRLYAFRLAVLFLVALSANAVPRDVASSNVTVESRSVARSAHTDGQAAARTCESVKALLERAERSGDRSDREHLLGMLRAIPKEDCANVFVSVLQTDALATWLLAH